MALSGESESVADQIALRWRNPMSKDKNRLEILGF